MSNESLVLAPESAVIPVYGNQENPQLSALEVFSRSEQTKRFKEKFGGATPQEQDNWFKKWLHATHVVFRCTPLKAFDEDRGNEVSDFIARAIK